MRFTRPQADWKAVTTSAPLTPANCPRGATMGTERVASPEDEGIRKLSGRYRRKTSSTKATGPAPLRADSPQWSTVSVTEPSFIKTVMPRLMPMMRATPSMSAQPATKVSAISSSRRRSTRPMTMPLTRNRAESSGNHQPQEGRARPISSKGMTL